MNRIYCATFLFSFLASPLHAGDKTLKSAVAERIGVEIASLESLYKQLHSHPEIAFQEEVTAARLTKELRALLTQARSIDYAQRLAGEFVDRAKQALYAFPTSEARDALMYLPDYVVARDR